MAKRSRYYHALIDSRILKSGADYAALQNVIVIMIVPYDPFQRGRMVYTFETRCKEDTTVEYEDGLKTIYLYTKGKQENSSQELSDMLKYMEKSTAENAKGATLQKIHTMVEEIKRDEEVGVSYMKSWEREEMIRQEGIQEGIREGIQAGKTEGEIHKLIEQICKKLRKGKNVEEIAEALEEDEEEIKSMCHIAAEYAPEFDCDEVYEAYKKKK
ncbi:MAG: Rpn family recombination-promoting nuclease/putative transposase [Lachnospiraceae bacterium]|nr:Rpn family recombination-promoting nuclease/putative transposase [Lachnospiraceae bacterium]